MSLHGHRSVQYFVVSGTIAGISSSRKASSSSSSVSTLNEYARSAGSRHRSRGSRTPYCPLRSMSTNRSDCEAITHMCSTPVGP